MDEVILVKKGDQKSELKRPGRHYRLMLKTKQIESIVAELDPQAESRWFQHQGEEMHLMLQGEIEYTVGEHSYKLSEGDLLWHLSNVRHRAKNIGKKKAVYVTVSSPPTFMWGDL
ncbi:MAG: cupin domain-containing protein [Candidatus Thermoplasmatota archaeon]|nr:cupin domain-containing protein [Candidatus Thermoplasmatota archaeon]